MKEKLERLRRPYVYLPLFFLVLLGMDLSFRHLYRGAAYTPWNDKIPFLFTLGWAALLTGLAWLLPGLIKKIYMGLAVGFPMLLLVVHSGMHSFFGDFFSFSDIRFAGDGADFFEADYIHFPRRLFLILAAALVGLVLALLCVPREESYSLPRVLASVLLVLLSVGGINLVRLSWLSGQTEVSVNNYEQRAAVYRHFSDTNACLRMAGLYQYTFRDFCLSYGVYDLLISDSQTIAELNDYYAAKEPDPDNEMTGLFKGKNLILIQLEAIDTWLINETAMPNLCALREKSMDFTRHYAPIYLAAGTFNTENIVNTGLVSPFTGGSVDIYSHNSYPFSAAHLFRGEGYTAKSFHGSPGKVYDREYVHPNWGYESYNAGYVMGMSDYGFDSEMINGFDLMVTEEQPFFTFIITYSGHGPYIGSTISEKHYALFEDLDEPEIVTHAYAHAYETDLFIGELLEKLEETGLLDDTVLAFYADHYDYYVLDDQVIMEQKDIYDENLIQQTPFFIYAADQQPRKIEKVTSSVDVLPTLVNLFDLPTDGRYYVGNDAFSANGGYAFFADYSWVDSQRYWSAASGERDELADRREKEIASRLEASWKTMNSNYFFHLEQ